MHAVSKCFCDFLSVSYWTRSTVELLLGTANVTEGQDAPSLQTLACFQRVGQPGGLEKICTADTG